MKYIHIENGNSEVYFTSPNINVPFTGACYHCKSINNFTTLLHQMM